MVIDLHTHIFPTKIARANNLQNLIGSKILLRVINPDTH